VLPPLGTFAHPLRQFLNFRTGKSGPRVYGRHPLSLGFRRDSPNQFAPLRIAVPDDLFAAAQVALGCCFAVQPERNLLRGGIGTVAGKAPVGQNRQNVAIEFNGRHLCEGRDLQ
jgi:hypothetical protein